MADPDRTAPANPAFIPPMPHIPVHYETVEQLAAEIHERRLKRGLQVRATTACHPEFGTFQGFNVYAFNRDDGAEEWLGCAVVQGCTADQLMAVIKATRTARPPVKAAA